MVCYFSVVYKLQYFVNNSRSHISLISSTNIIKWSTLSALTQLNTSKRSGGWVGRKNVLPLILCSEKKNSYIIVGISPLGTTRGAGDMSEEDQVATHYSSMFRCPSILLSVCLSAVACCTFCFITEYRAKESVLLS